MPIKLEYQVANSPAQFVEIWNALEEKQLLIVRVDFTVKGTELA